MRLRAWIAAGLLPLNACFSFVPAQSGVPGRTAEVRLSLVPTRIGLDGRALQDIRTVRGEVIRWEDEVLLLSASRLTSAEGQEFAGRGLTVRIPRERIEGVEVKRISRVRTGILVGAGVAFAVVAGILTTRGGAGGERTGGGPAPK